MYLTKENLKTIERYLRENGVKDSQFPSIEEATGDEYLVIDTASGNRRIKLKSIINLLEASGIEDSLNSDATNRSLSARQGKVLKEEILKLEENKQDSLKSGETIKTINNESILGKGNIEIPKEVYVLPFSANNLMDSADNEGFKMPINGSVKEIEDAIINNNILITEYDESHVTTISYLQLHGNTYEFMCAVDFRILKGTIYKSTDRTHVDYVSAVDYIPYNITAYITDFTVFELLDLAGNRIESISSNISFLESALLEGRNILVPYDEDASTGYALLTGYVEDLIYFRIILDSGEIIGQVLRQSTSISDEVGKVTFHTKQDTLISGKNIKTINGESILGEGNISITGSGNTSQIYHWEGDISAQGVITKEEYEAISKADIIILEGISGAKQLDPEEGTMIINFHIGKGGLIIEGCITVKKDLTYSFEYMTYSIPSTEYIDNAIKEAITNTLTTEV